MIFSRKARREAAALETAQTFLEPLHEITSRGCQSGNPKHLWRSHTGTVWPDPAPGVDRMEGQSRGDGST